MNYEHQKQYLIKAIYAISVIALVIFIFRYAIFWLMPFVFAFGVAFVTKPLTNMITRVLKCNRKPIAALICFLFYGTIGVLVTILLVNLMVAVREWAIDIPALYEEEFLPDMAETYNDIVTLAGRVSPELAMEVEIIANNMANEVQGLISNISGSLLGTISALALSIPSLFISVIFAIIGSFFISMDYYRITNFLVGQFNEKNQKIIMDAKNHLVNSFFKIITSYGAIMCITFMELIIGFKLAGIDRFILLAFCVALMDIMPVLGTGGVMVPWIVIELVMRDFRMALTLLAIYLFVTVVRNIVEPKLVGHRVGLHPVLMLFSMFIGGTVLGPLGIVIMPFMMIVVKNLNESGQINVYKDVEPPVPSWVADKERFEKAREEALEEVVPMNNLHNGRRGML
ncbi:MAG: sporulation integral membrane protein YtvI [Firmicutes bacterium]|nr:sporulation integral membrane protein YtvI [Bacillota bacterium]